MEIEIDAAAVGELTTREYAQAASDVAAVGAVDALERSQRRHDACLAAAPDAGTLACKAGCFWCCYFSVDVRPVELFRIVEFMSRELSPVEQTRVVDEARVNATVLRALSEDERARRNVKCPFLASGRCVIFAARPQTCRNYHATNAAGCQQAYEQPDNLDIDPEFAPYVYQFGRAHADAFSKALSDAGYDTRAYELNAALTAVLDDPQRRRRELDEGRCVFPELDGIEVPLELMEP